jgi:APA family basic amino acid/polyamine antiporter
MPWGGFGVSGEGSAHPRDRLLRDLSLRDAVFLVVASVIGSGIFFTPGQVAELLPHPGWILAAWAVGGLLSLAGALANAELAAMFPRAGGDYVYLREGVHPVAGFLVGWLSFGIIYTGTIAALAIALAQALAVPLELDEAGTVAVAIALTLACSALNYFGVRRGALANNITSIVKIGALLAAVAVGLLSGAGDWSQLAAGDAPGSEAIGWVAFGWALSPVLFSYLGWNASIYVASEIHDASRNVPRSLFLGLAICSGIYLLVNVLYLYALPMAELRGVSDAGSATAAALFGPRGGALVTAFVMVSILGTLNATVLVGPRIAYAMALDGLFFGGADRVSERFRTPGVAIAIQAVIAVGLLLVLRSFPSALGFTTFAILIAMAADVVALFRLRRMRPDLARPYRAWGHPWVTGVYGVATVALAVNLAFVQPQEAAIGMAILLAGLPVYVRFSRR